MKTNNGTVLAVRWSAKQFVGLNSPTSRIRLAETEEEHRQMQRVLRLPQTQKA